MDKIKLKDGRIINVDFGSIDSVLSVSKSDWLEIKQQLEEVAEFIKTDAYMEYLRKWAVLNFGRGENVEIFCTQAKK